MSASMTESRPSAAKSARSWSDEDKGRSYSERFFGSFERRIALPTTVDEDKIDATLKDGVLEVRLPKSAPAPPPEARKVEIKTA